MAGKTGPLSSVLKFGILSTIAGVLSIAILAPALALTGMAASTGIAAFENLPAYIRPIDASQSSTIYATKDGKPIKMATFYHENRIEVPFESISPNLINAVIATEDPRFYEHGGVDVISLLRAGLTNIATAGDGPGASTITMQYVRQSLVESANLSGDAEAIAAATEVTVERKLREIRLAIALEQEYSKKEILAGYLNLVFLGNQINGVETASQYYFGKSSRDLNVPQAALLAAMLKSPNDYKPDEADNLERAIGRRNYVIQQMADEGYITQEQADAYKESPIQTQITKVTPGCELDQTTAFFCDYVVWTIRNSPEFGQTSEDREMLLRRGGLEIYTTLDVDLQQTAWNSVMERLPADNEYGFGTAAISVEVGTGRIVSMAQNRYFDQTQEPEVGRTSVNFNTDKEYGGSSGFQSGSTYKVFTLAEWLKQGHTLEEHVDGRVTTGYDLDGDGELDPKIWDVATQFTASCGGVGGTWEVNNSGDKTIDDISVFQAVATSQNTAFAAMAAQLDLCGIRDTAMDFGIRRADGTELQYVPASILGVNEVSPLSMAAAFAAIANQGVYCSPVAIDKVVKRSTSEELAVPESLCNQAVTPDIAAAMTLAMRNVMTGGTGSAANTNDGTPLAGKTGTTDDRIHTWMVGFSSEVATAVWVGNVKGLVKQGGKSVNGMAVTVIRHAIWKDIMKEINAKYGGESFPDAPSNLVSAPTLMVPEVGGLDATTAEMQVKLAGFSAGVELEPVASSQPIGTVAYTVPAAGESVPKGTLVKIFISSGGATLMPDVSGMDIDVAEGILEGLGLITSLPQPSQGWLYNKCNTALPEGVVFGTDPAAGTEVANASAVVLIPNNCRGNGNEG